MVGGPIYTTASVTYDWDRSGDVKTTRKAKGYGWMDGPTDRKHDKISRNQLGRSSNARTARKMPKDGWTDTVII